MKTFSNLFYVCIFCRPPSTQLFLDLLLLIVNVYLRCYAVILPFRPCLSVFPQIAIAIGVLTSNRGGGRRTTLADWTWQQSAIAGCSGRGAVAGCHRRVPL